MLPDRVKLYAIVAAVLAIPASGFAQWVNYPSAGVPRGPDGKTNLAAPAPRTSDGKPDLSGVWQAESQEFFFNLAAGLKPEDVAMQPWAKALQEQRVADEHGDDPLARCLPHGVPRVNTNGLFPFKIIQTPRLVVILYEQLNLFRQIFMDGRKLINNPNPTWLGYSTGRWDGDTLVIETSGFNDQTWLDTERGHPATGALHVTERFRRKDFGNLEVQATIDDPKAYNKPWTTTVQRMHLQLDTDILEFVCNENEKDIQHAVKK
ncbi:MAG: hypothetical protein C5B51_11185 [Terriglobia bacterium]|nr:MAG: hypothetical protein C5B51_11185 [Terriglobia bacterium]